jgi:hypothetical protein
MASSGLPGVGRVDVESPRRLSAERNAAATAAGLKARLSGSGRSWTCDPTRLAQAIGVLHQPRRQVALAGSTEEHAEHLRACEASLVGKAVDTIDGRDRDTERHLNGRRLVHGVFSPAAWRRAKQKETEAWSARSHPTNLDLSLLLV